MINKKEVLNTFLELVKIDSPSGHEKKITEHTIKVLKKIKINAKTDKYGNVIFRIPGTGQPLFLSAHLDTVEPGRNIKPVVKKDLIRSDGSTVLGADDKAGITAIIELLKYIKKKNIKHRTLEIIFTREEETGLVGATNLNFKDIISKEGLILDSCRSLGHITIASPFIYNIDIEVTGRAAHAGAFPEKGINAIMIASKAISEIKTGRIDRTTTNNIGVIKGGSVVNCVPEKVSIKAEARSHFLKKAQEQVDIINKAFKKYVRRYKAKLYFRSRLEVHGYAYSPRDKFIKQVSDQNKKFGFKTVYEHSGGASDANIYASKKIKALDIAYGGANAHTTRESIKLSELVSLTEYLVDFVRVK